MSERDTQSAQSGWRPRLRRASRYGLWRGRWMCPGETVDPAPFSEDEFPVYCAKCDYLLRGLPDGACPECGQQFERGCLLVEQYVIGRSGRRAWADAKPVLWWVWGAIIVLSAAVLLLIVLAVYLPQTIRPYLVHPVVRIAAIPVIGFLLVLLTVFSLVYPFTVARRERKKGRRILDEMMKAGSNREN